MRTDKHSCLFVRIFAFVKNKGLGMEEFEEQHCA